MITIVLSVLAIAFVVGLMMGFICLRIDRRRKKDTKTINVKDGITLEYDCSRSGIYETIKAFIDGR
jgi:uncharacterized membrane-anchored protein YhcB (DUF1043 family)